MNGKGRACSQAPLRRFESAGRRHRPRAAGGGCELVGGPDAPGRRRGVHGAEATGTAAARPVSLPHTAARTGRRQWVDGSGRSRAGRHVLAHAAGAPPGDERSGPKPGAQNRPRQRRGGGRRRLERRHASERCAMPAQLQNDSLRARRLRSGVGRNPAPCPARSALRQAGSLGPVKQGRNAFSARGPTRVPDQPWSAGRPRRGRRGRTTSGNRRRQPAVSSSSGETRPSARTSRSARQGPAVATSPASPARRAPRLPAPRSGRGTSRAVPGRSWSTTPSSSARTSTATRNGLFAGGGEILREG